MSTEPANTRGLIGSWRLRMLLQLLRSLQRTWIDDDGTHRFVITTPGGDGA